MHIDKKSHRHLRITRWKTLANAAFGVWLALHVGAAQAQAPTSPYVGQEQRSLKALSAKEIADLRAGRGMGFSKVAELNHVPGPLHVLELSEALGLSSQQRTQTQRVFDRMSRQAQALGERIVDQEAELDALFSKPAELSDRTIKQYVARIAGLQGELRFVHLKAHVSMLKILTPDQVVKYDSLRGYANSQSEQRSGEHSNGSAPHHHQNSEHHSHH